MPSKARSKSGVVALPHPRSAKVSITYCARKCTDQFHAHVSTIVGFTKSSLSPCSSWANSALSISMACHVVLEPLLSKQHFQIHPKAQNTLTTHPSDRISNS